MASYFSLQEANDQENHVYFYGLVSQINLKQPTKDDTVLLQVIKSKIYENNEIFD